MGKHQSIPIRTPQKVELLAISARSRDCQMLQSILIHTNWLVHWVADAHEAMLFLNDHPVPVLVCPEELPNATWSDLLAATQELMSPPKVLVYSDRADQVLGNEVLDAGGYDLLSTPLQRDEVLRAISLACRTWRDEIRRQETHAAAMTA
jgi:DNA-binding NtrC family response regulator